MACRFRSGRWSAPGAGIIGSSRIASCAAPTRLAWISVMKPGMLTVQMERYPIGGHIIRRNHVSDCGICGIAGVGAVDGTLVENNLVEQIGAPYVERIWETAGLKFHTCDHVLIRRNIFRHITSAPGVWLDYLNRFSWFTQNIFYNESSQWHCIH